MVMKTYRVTGTRVTEQGPGSATELIRAKSLVDAIKKARELGYGGLWGDFNVELVKKKRRMEIKRRKPVAPFSDINKLIVGGVGVGVTLGLGKAVMGAFD